MEQKNRLGIVKTPLIPLRKEADECSEMTSQFLYGELFHIIEEIEKWLLVRNMADDYIGWIDKKMAVQLTLSEWEKLDAEKCYKVAVSHTYFSTIKTAEKMLLPGGSVLRESEKNSVNNLHLLEATSDIPFNTEQLITLAKQYINAPYLWGGKSIFGIDCSGLTQVVFSTFNIPLKRDASEQALQGKLIPTLEKSKAGDLAFFENEGGKIIHVGILLSSSSILHASGSVKIEEIDSKGILCANTNTYSHRLSVIKRHC